VDTNVSTTKNISYQQLITAVQTLTAAVGASVSAAADVIPIYNAGDTVGRKITYQSFMDATNKLTTLAAGSASAAADFIPIFNVQDGATKKLLLSDVIAIRLGTEQASTSGTSIDFTGIPAWVRRITINLEAVSHDAASEIMFQIGDAGGVETSGYDGFAAQIASSVSVANPTSAWRGMSTTAVAAYSGTVTLTLKDAANNTWACFGVLGRNDTGAGELFAGTKSLSATLDRVRITSGNGTANFDAGSINITYE
jgi:hypothetical protein